MTTTTTSTTTSTRNNSSLDAATVVVSPNDDDVDDNSSFVIKCIFCLLGIGILLPWNAFVSAKPYFQARRCSSFNSSSSSSSATTTATTITDDNDNDNDNVELWFGFLYNLSCVLSLAIIILWQYCKDRRQRQRQRHNMMQQAPVIIIEENDNDNDDDDGTNEAPSSSSSSSNSYKHSHHNDDNYWMIVLPLWVYLVVFVLTTILVLLPSIPTVVFWTMTYVGLAVCGVCTAFCSAGIVGTAAAAFDVHHGIHPYFAGQAVGGLLVSLTNIVAAAVLQDPTSFLQTHCNNTKQQQYQYDDQVVVVTVDKSTRSMQMSSTTLSSSCIPYQQIDWASFAYFLLACIVLVACLVGYSYIDKYQGGRRRQAQRVLPSATTATTATTTTYEALTAIDDSNHNVDDVRGSIELHDNVIPDEFKNNNKSHGCQPLADESETNYEFEEQQLQQIVDDDDDDDDRTTVLAVLHSVKAPAFAVFVVFFVTLSLFPGWTSQLRSVHQCTWHNVRLVNDLYTPLTFVLFNASDLAGRILAEYVPVHDITNSKLVTLSLGRLLFFPLLLLCVANDSVVSATFRTSIPYDMYSLLIQVTFGIGNGLVTTLCFVQAPRLLVASSSSPPQPTTTTTPPLCRRVEQQQNQQQHRQAQMQTRASEILNLSLSLGLLSGSIFSFVVSRFATGHW